MQRLCMIINYNPFLPQKPTTTQAKLNITHLYPNKFITTTLKLPKQQLLKKNVNDL